MLEKCNFWNFKISLCVKNHYCSDHHLSLCHSASWSHWARRDLIVGALPCQDTDVHCVFVVVQMLSRVQLIVTPRTAARQATLVVTISQSLLKLMSIESVMPSNDLILCHPLLLLPSTFPSIGVFSNESALCIRWPKYWNFSFSISPSNEYSGLISFKIDW